MTNCMIPKFSLQAMQKQQKRQLFWQRVAKICLAILLTCFVSGILVVGVHAGEPVKFQTDQYKGVDAMSNTGSSTDDSSWTVSAMVKDVVNMHKQLDNLLPQNNPIFYIFRLLGWLIACGLALLVDGISYAVFQLFALLGGSVANDGKLSGGLFDGKGFFAPYKGGGDQLIASPSTGGALIHNLTVVGMALMVISIILLGIQVVIKPQQIKSAALHICAGLILIVALPSFIVGGLALTNALIDTTGLNKNGSMGSQIVAENVTDVFYYERNNMNTTTDATSKSITLSLRDSKVKNDYSQYANNKNSVDDSAELRKILFINPIEMIDSKTMCEESGDKQRQVKHTVFWETKLASRRNGNGTAQYLENRWDGTILSDKKIGPFSEEYMRYKVSWFNLYVGLAVTGFVLIMAGIKWVRLLFELGIKQGLTQLLALVDVRTMQRVKQCLQSLLGTFAALFGTALSLAFYMAANSWIGKLTKPDGMNDFAWGILQLFIQVGLAWAAIDGPDIFEKLFGVDVGVKNSMQTLFAMQSVGRAAKGLTNGVFGTRQYIPGSAGGESGATGAAGGAVGGFSRVGGLFGRQGFVSRMGRTAKGAASAIGNTASGAAAIPGAVGGFIHGKSAARKALHNANGVPSGAAGTINAGKVNTGSLSVNGSSAGASTAGSKINRTGSNSARGGQNSSLRSAAVSSGTIGGHRVPQTNTQSVTKPNGGGSTADVHSPSSPALSGSTPVSRMTPAASVPLTSQSPAGGKRANVAKPAPTSAAQPAVSRNAGVRPAAAAQAVQTAINRTPHSPTSTGTRQVTPRMSGSGSAGTGYAAGSGSASNIPLRGSGETLGEHIDGQFHQAGSYIHQRAASLVKDDQGNIKKNALTRPFRAASSASDFAYNATIKRAQKH